MYNTTVTVKYIIWMKGSDPVNEVAMHLLWEECK